MPNNVTAKTKLAPRKRLLLAGAAALLVAVATGISASRNHHYVHVGSRQYVTTIASTPAAQEQGLSYRTSMSSHQAMLFTYPKSQALCFWMKDMYFSLDILWLDANHRIVHLEQNVSPKTYPKAFCANAQYVLELRAGQVVENGAHLGQKVDF